MNTNESIITCGQLNKIKLNKSSLTHPNLTWPNKSIWCLDQDSLWWLFKSNFVQFDINKLDYV